MRLYIGGTEVQLAPDELPEFTYSLIEIIDPSKTRGSTSTTFDIPNTNATRIALGGPAMSETVAGEQSIRIGDGGQVLFEGPACSIKRQKLEVEAVGVGGECGVVLGDGDWADVQPGDVLLCIRRGSAAGGGSAAARQQQGRGGDE